MSAASGASALVPIAASGEWFLAAAIAMVLVGAALGLSGGAGSEVTRHARGSRRGDTAGSDADGLDGDGELPGSEGQRFPSGRGTR